MPTTGIQATLQDLKQLASFDIESPQGFRNCLSMLARDRVDFFFIDELAGQYVIDLQHEYAGSEFHSVRMPDQIGEVDLHLVISHDNPRAEAIIEQFNASLQEMKESGQIQQLVDEYLKANHEDL